MDRFKTLDDFSNLKFMRFLYTLIRKQERR